jgi:hypothetical protein
MKRIISKIVLFATFTLLPGLLTFADPPNPPGPGGNPVTGGGTPVGAPIDDGMTILLALGIGYGVYKLYEIRKKSKVDAHETV